MRLGIAVLFLAPAVLAQDAARVEGYPEAYSRKPAPSALRMYKMQLMRNDRQPPRLLESLSGVPCVDGDAAGYPCNNVDLEAFVPLADMDGVFANSIWGWTDPETDREYALVGQSNGTAFVDITDPRAPVFLGLLPTHTEDSSWRDIKTYRDHAFIGSEAYGHGLQVFDLTQLRSVTDPPVVFGETAHYGLYGYSHTTALNEATGFVYAVGSDTCGGGSHIVDVRTPTAPSFAGCVADDGYTHETQCVVYAGPDATYRGREICFNYNEIAVTIVDVTDKSAPLQLSRTTYDTAGYVHQGWLTEDHAFMLLDDEFDECFFGFNQTTYVWDVADLDSPILMSNFVGPTTSIDHNQYVKGFFAYQANYRSGLSILDLCCIATGELHQVAYFDIYPDDDYPDFNGAWGVYPYFASGVVIVSGMEQGLFVLRPSLPAYPEGGVCPGIDPGLLPDLSNALRAVKSGAEALLSVTPAAPEGGGFNVYRSEAKDAVGPILGSSPSTTSSSFGDAGVIGDGLSYFYQMRAVTACGLEGP